MALEGAAQAPSVMRHERTPLRFQFGSGHNQVVGHGEGGMATNAAGGVVEGEVSPGDAGPLHPASGEGIADGHATAVLAVGARLERAGLAVDGAVKHVDAASGMVRWCA